MPPTSRTRGFTIVEAMLVVSIMGVLAAIGYQAISGLAERSSYASTANDILQRLKQMRAEAFGEGAPIVLVIRKTTREWWAISDANGDFDLGTFDPANPAPGTDRVISHRTLPQGFIIGPSNGYGSPYLPAPFGFIPSNNPCTFCGADYGAITFHGNGTATLSGNNPAGGSFTIAFVTTAGSHTMTIGVLARTGGVASFERFR
jgi:prepilin-type N-terminal cleavage/methylation domain-containing protein